jgi:hypothetical protein
MRRIASLAILILASTFAVAAQAPKSASSGVPQSAAIKATATPRHHVASAPAPHASSGYGNVPLSFEENRGQTDSQVKYLARGKGYTLFLTPTREVLALRRVVPSKSESQTTPDAKTPRNYSQSVLEFDLVGANEQAQVSGANRFQGISNYYIGNDPTKWHTGIPNYGKVIYRNAYPGIDLAYYGNPGQLESDFILAPGADPSQIRMRVDGAKDLQIAAAGDLMLSLESGSVKLQRPVAYQIIHGVRREIRGGYQLLAANEVGITLAPYDRSQKVIIDPTLSFSTYLGGTGVDQANGVGVDSTGEAYVTGFTSSVNFPTQSPAQGTLGGTTAQNAFVTKFAASGTSLVYSTYLGGNSSDDGMGIAVDSAGSAYVTGLASSSNFPLHLPISNQDSFVGSACAFVSAFSSTGALTFSTYLCGGTDDVGGAIAVDSSKNIYITGSTSSATFPTVNPIQTSIAGPENTFVSKLAAVSASGSSLLFSTYFGGNGLDYAFGLALDGSTPPNIYIVGQTRSTVFPTKNALQGKNNSAIGGYNAFVAELSVPNAGPVGPTEVYGTFLGGSANDEATGIAADSAGNAYVAGTTTSPDFPVKSTLQAPAGNGTDNIFLSKIAAGGGTLDFSTFFGGSNGAHASAIALDTTGDIYITGQTFDSDFPTRIPLQATLNASQAAFVTEFKGDGSDYIFSTYLGGSSSDSLDEGYGIALDSNANIYVAGLTGSLDFPTVTPFQPQLKSLERNAFVAKIAPATPAGPQLFPATLDFGTVQTGTSSTEVVTLANGTTALDITNIALSGPDAADFSDFSTCGATVPPTIVCTFTVTFAPASTGTETATVTVTESSGTQTFTLSGTGGSTTGPTPGTITVNPLSLTFANQEVGTTSALQFLTVNVTGTNPVTLNFPGTTGVDPSDFSGTGDGTCEFDTPLAAGTSCTIGVDFRPTATGARTATLQVTGTFTTSPVNVTLSGTGTPQIAVLNPTFLQFPNTVVDSTSAAMTVTLTNKSTTVALTTIVPTVQSFTSDGTFAISGSTCPAATGPGLAPGASCMISITYTANSAGTAEGELSVSDSDTGTSPQTAILFGTGLNATATLAPVSPAFLAFGRQTVGTTSNLQGVFLQNIGNTALTFTTPLSGTNLADFAAASTCGGSIPAGGTCEVTVTFAPTAAGPFFATLTISSSATGAPQTVGLSGTGIPATTVSLLPNPLVFPATTVDQTSAPEYAFLNNTGTTADALRGIPTITGTDSEDFELSFTGPGNTPCSQTQLLNAQAVCVIGVVFTPTATGLRTATLQVTDTATGTPHSITLQGGTGTAPLQITTTSPLPGGTVGVAYSTTLTATGGTPSYSWGFVTGALPPGLSVGATGTISGTPTTAGTFTFTVQVTDSTSPTPQSTTATFSLTVSAGTGGLTFTSVTLPNGAVTVPYGADIQVTGGTQPYTFSATGLPTSFAIDATATGDAAAGHVRNDAPMTAGTFTFNVTVTDSTTPTPLTGNATISLTIAPMPANTQPGLLKGQYAMLLRGFNEVTGVEEAVVGSLTFDGKGNITGGALDVNSAGTGSVGILSNVGATGLYVIGPDNRGVMSVTPTGQNPGIFTFSVGNVLNGVASTAYMTSFTDDSGTGDLYAGTLQLQDPTSFNNTAIAGTYVYANTGQDPLGNRAAEIGLTTLNNANAVTSGSADTNLNGKTGSITTITGTYTTPDTNGRTLLTLTLDTTPSSTVVYQISANEVVHMTLDARATNALLVGTASRQLNPNTFSNASLAGPDVLSLAGTAGTQGTSADIGLVTVTPGTTPTVNITLDTNDHGNVTIGQALTGPLSIATSGRGTMTPGTNTVIFYLTQPDTGFAMTTDTSVSLGPIQPQIGAPFSATPFANNNLFFGQQEAVTGQTSEFSGIAALGPATTLTATDDETHYGGNLFYDQALGTFTYGVTSTGHFTLTSSTQGNSSGYVVSPYEVIFMDTAGPASDPTPSAHPHVGVVQSIPAQVAATLGTITIAPTSLTFASQTVGTTSATQTLTVSNTGGVNVTFSSIVTTGDFAGATTAQCLSIAVEGTPCTFQITFKPTAAGTLTGAITFTDNATGSPQTVTLSGTAVNGPATVTVAPTSLTFASQSLNSTSPAQNVTVTNTGTGPVTFTSFSVTGSGSGDFALAGGAGTGACNPTGILAASSSCAIGVTFTPTAVGEFTATLSIADNATGSPQLVELNGTGNNSPVTISIPPGGSTTGTATPGGTAYFGLEITGAPGVTGTVQLGCTPSSPTITCTVIPSSIVLTGKPVEVAFGIQTYCQGATGAGFVPGMPGSGPWGGIGLLLLSLLLGGLAWAMQRNRRVALTFAVLMLVAMGTAACGSLAKGPNGATPPGTYSLTLTTTINGQTQTMTNFLTLVVQ